MKTEFKKFFNDYLKSRFSLSVPAEMKLLRQAILYTLKAPSSLFRPRLAMATSQFLKKPARDIFPWATALEIIHGASLIHDDLPCMDNSLKRRGKKSNHLVFGEDMATLAGACLFVEAFSLLTHPVFKEKYQEMLDLLVRRAGFYGIMGGQALDIRGKSSSTAFFLRLSEMKTGSLILSAVEGPALLWSPSERELSALRKYARALGRAYQVADDLTDGDLRQKSVAVKKNLLRKLTRESESALKPFKERAKPLIDLCLLNEKRGLKKPGENQSKTGESHPDKT